MTDMKRIAASIFAASMVTPPLPRPPVRSLDRKPSGKNRDKVKAARKQRRKAKK
jgi:hypothetical protein